MGTYDDLAGTLLALSGNRNTVTVRRAFVDFTGSLEAGMMLDQLLYWTPRASRKDGFVAKSYGEWSEELCLTQYAVRKASKELKDLGIIETKLRKWNGAPTVHYRICMDELNRKWICWIRQIQETAKTTNPSAENDKSLTEITTETTTETTSPELVGDELLDSFDLGLNHQKSGTNQAGNWAIPVQAGGAHSPAEAIVDGMCRYNGLSQGIDELAEKDRRSWVSNVAEIMERYSTTTAQARLAWRVYALNFAFRNRVTPFYSSFESELGPILAGVRAGDITEKSLLEEEERHADSTAQIRTTGGYNARPNGARNGGAGSATAATQGSRGHRTAGNQWSSEEVATAQREAAAELGEAGEPG